MRLSWAHLSSWSSKTIMLTTVTEIEDEIMRIVIAHHGELLSAEERFELIVEEGKAMLDKYEKDLNEHYAGSKDGTYEEEYLALYQQARQNIIDGTRRLLEKEAEQVLLKIKEAESIG